jgi:hypothetical protein
MARHPACAFARSSLSVRGTKLQLREDGYADPKTPVGQPEQTEVATRRPRRDAARGQATLGHGNIATTSGYLHARPESSSGLKLDPGVFLR